MLCEPLAMASVFRSISHATRSTYSQHGTWMPHHQKPSHLKLRDISPFSKSSSSLLIAKAQLACCTSTITTEKLQKVRLSSVEDASETSASDAPTTPSLPRRYAHLSELLSQLCDDVDVASAMDPWLQKLSLYDWNQLLVECGRKDWKISMRIMDFFRGNEAFLDQSVLSPRKDGEEASDSTSETSDDSSRSSDDVSEAVLDIPHESTLQKDTEMTGSSTEKPDSSASSTPALKLYTTLVNLLVRRRCFEEVDRVQLQMKEAEIEPNGHFYNVLLDCHVERRSFATAFEILQDMKSAGFEPHQFFYDKLAYIYMNQENPDMKFLEKLAEDMKGRNLQVCIAIYKRLLKIHWEARNVADAEEVFEAMLAIGYTPELKVLLKLMQVNGRRGNHDRVVELLELMVKLGMKPNAAAYDYLVHAYCKSGLLEKAKETLLKFESVLGFKPTTIALNMLIDGYGKQGLHEEALQTFEQIKQFGFRPTEVSYSSIISAMAQVGKIDSAAQLYGRMVKEGIQPNLHTYLTLIRIYTKYNRTREGHKIYRAMRKAPLEMTEAAYSTSLALYVDGTWYHHAAAVLREMEEVGKGVDAVAHSTLIRSFSFLHNKATPLSIAVQESGFRICKLLTTLVYSTLESQKLQPELIEEVFSLLEEWKGIGRLEARALVYNAFLDFFWRKGYKEMAKKILDLGREVYVGYSRPRQKDTQWLVDVRGLGVGGAKIALTDCLIKVEEAMKEERGNDCSVVVITGDEFSLSLPQDNTVVKRAVTSMLSELGFPFVQLPESSARMEASLADTLEWLSQPKVKEALSFTDSC